VSYESFSECFPIIRRTPRCLPKLNLDFLGGSERSLQYLNENNLIGEEKDDPFGIDLKMFNTTPGDSLEGLW